jgi:N-acetylglucosaminyl-diphospho-decaprenol L-rhamnosyltransferase
VFDAIGGLDDGFFLYYEETDFARRAARAGFKSAYVPASRIVHYCGQSTGVTQPDGSLHAPPQYFHDSRRRYFTKHHGAIYARAVEGARVTGRAIQRLRRSVS